jgi:hypothetical protein
VSAPSSVTAHKRDGYWRLLGEVEGCCLVLGVLAAHSATALTSRADHTDGRDCCSRQPRGNACCVYIYRRQS